MFVKGVSGNPRGRPKVDPELRDLARKHTVMAIRVLAEVARDKRALDGARVNAASALLDRGYGRPNLVIDAEVKVRTLSDEQINARILDLAPKLIAVGGASDGDEESSC